MRIIPLHSIVITVGTSLIKEQEVLSHFDDYEILSKESICRNLFGSPELRQNYDLINYELYRQANLKLTNGERVILSGSNLVKGKRLNIANLSKKFGVPVYYILTHDPSVTCDKNKMELYDQNSHDIMRGDGFAHIIDFNIEHFTPIKKYPNKNILEEIKKRGYKGITVAADIHGNLEALRDSLDWALARNRLYVQLGDLIDYGINSIECVELMYDRVIRGKAINVIGNHERKLERWFLQEKNSKTNPDYFKYKSPVNLSDSNLATTKKILELSLNQRKIFEIRFNSLMNLGRYHFNIGNVTVSHASFCPEMLNIHTNRMYGKLESLSLYGETNYDSVNKVYNKSYTWTETVPENHISIVGHDILNKVNFTKMINDQNGTSLFLDTGSSKGGRLTTVDMKIEDDDTLSIENYHWF